jgi:hypothetical protein
MNDRPVKIAKALRKLLKAHPGATAIRINDRSTRLWFEIECATDDAARDIAAAFDLELEVKTVRADGVWWLGAEGENNALQVFLAGPMHRQPIKPVDDEKLDTALEAVSEVSKPPG